jgi:hypothetical protein
MSSDVTSHDRRARKDVGESRNSVRLSIKQLAKTVLQHRSL